jgi:hypothetical protein
MLIKSETFTLLSSSEVGVVSMSCAWVKREETTIRKNKNLIILKDCAL